MRVELTPADERAKPSMGKLLVKWRPDVIAYGTADGIKKESAATNGAVEVKAS